MTKIAIIMAIIIAILEVYREKQISKLRNQTIESFKRVCEEIKEDDRR